MLTPVQALAQHSQPYLQELPQAAMAGKTLIFFIGGDGGWNRFSKELCNTFSSYGYPVVALDARSYFWQKKTPEETAAFVGAQLKKYAASWHTAGVLMVGYSFGADIVPFVLNRLEPAQLRTIGQAVLISPSPHTTFEVTISGMMDIPHSDGYSVHRELEKVRQVPVKLVFGRNEDFDPFFSGGKKLEPLLLPGGHHYQGNANQLGRLIVGR